MMRFAVRKDGFPLVNFEAKSLDAAIDHFMKEFSDKQLVKTQVAGSVAFFESAMTLNKYQLYPQSMDKDLCL